MSDILDGSCQYEKYSDTGEKEIWWTVISQSPFNSVHLIQLAFFARAFVLKLHISLQISISSHLSNLAKEVKRGTY